MTDQLKPRSYFDHARDLLLLGFPLIITQVAQFGLHMTDVLFVGRYSVEAGAALVLAGGYWFIIFIFLAGVAFAVMPLVAAANAEKDTTTIRRCTRMSLWIGLLFSILAYPMFWFSDVILGALGQDEAILGMSRTYLLIVGIEMLPALWVASMRSYFSALEITRILLVVVSIGLTLNAFLDWLLIYGNWGLPELGVAGSAIGSLIVSSLMFALYAGYAQIRTRDIQLFRNPFGADWDMFRKLLGMGLPIGMTSLAEVGMFNFAALMVGWLGTIALAAHGFALHVTALTFMVQIGLSQAATIQIGAAYGRKDEADMRKTGITVIGLSFICALLASALFLLIPEILIDLFMSPDDPDRLPVLAIGVGLMFWAALMQISDGGQVIALALLRGVQDTAVPMRLALISYWIIGLPACYLFTFTFEWGPQGIWAGFILGLTLAWILLSWRFWMVKVKLS